MTISTGAFDAYGIPQGTRPALDDLQDVDTAEAEEGDTIVLRNLRWVPGKGGDDNEVTIAADQPNDGTELWLDLDDDTGTGGGGDNEVVISTTQPPSPVELWVDTSTSSETGETSYTHTQSVPATDWVVVHNLGRRPTVQATDTSAHLIIGSVTHDSLNQLTIHFAVALAGTAYCS